MRPFLNPVEAAEVLGTLRVNRVVNRYPELLEVLGAAGIDVESCGDQVLKDVLEGHEGPTVEQLREHLTWRDTAIRDGSARALRPT